MLKPTLAKALNAQIDAELFSSALYLSMAGHFDSQGLPGIAHWMRLQAEEERGHALKFFDHVLERGGQPKLGALQAPPSSWSDAVAAFKEVVRHEEKVSALIHSLAALARRESDFATENFLQFFIREQVEEEAQARLLLQHFEMAGSSKGSLMMMDHRLGKRA